VPLPIKRGIGTCLEDTEAVDPDVFNTQNFGDLDGLLESFGEVRKGNSGLELLDV
jgi:hypothetical protein